MPNKFKKIALLAGDVAFLYVSLYIALLLRYFRLPDKQIWDEHFLPFTLIFSAWVVIFFIYTLYNLDLAVKRAKFYRLSLQALITAGLASIVYFYITPHTNITPKTNLVVFAIVFIVLFFIWRNLYYLAVRSYIPKENIAIIGFNKQSRALVSEINKNPHLGYKTAFILDPFVDKKQSNDNVPIFNNTSDLHDLITKKNINTLVLATDPSSLEKLRNLLFSALHLKINFYSLPQFYESITGKIPIEAINKMWFLQNLSEGRKKWFDAIKRIYDLSAAFIILTATLPLWIVIALAIKLDSQGPIFFKQKRAGQYGKPFRIIKFRTMSIENNHHTPTQEQDKRITTVGSFLRKTRLDEVPQVLNIIKGEMSFVGPRPERPELIIKLEQNIPFYRERMLVKPGLTGWDQISGEYHSPSIKDTIKKLQYDLYYIKNRSFYLDLSIILKTLSTIISRAGR
jgi:exopolysaccharide biosynthesis polyprenyl glycosylphosphotransferase